MKKILLLSGYDAASHRYWRKTLVEKMPEFEWHQLALPDRHFYWRVRGNSLSFGFQHQQKLKQHYDLMIVTSMVDLSSLRGFCPSLANIPTIVYFHENQFVYPVNDNQQNLVHVQMTNIYTALCADLILFNSGYNMETFISGTEQLLDRLPDSVPQGLMEQIKETAKILPVPISTNTTHKAEPSGQLNKPPNIVWNHRWEYDKQPEVFFDALAALKADGQPFRLHVLGQSFRTQPECFSRAKELFADEIESFGYQPKDKYYHILSKADLIVSTALHDFQGLSLQEGIIHGCIPIAPERMVYPEYIPPDCLYPIDDDPAIEANNLFNKLKSCISSDDLCAPDLGNYSFERLIPKYRQHFNQLIL